MPDFHSFLMFAGPRLSEISGIVVPQMVFNHPTQFPHKTPITFSTHGRLGVNLGDVFDGSFVIDKSLIVPNLSETAEKITLRINWPGYDPWRRTLQIFDHTSNANPITMQKLAHEIASSVSTFFRDYSQIMPRSVEKDWSVDKWSLRQATLLELRHVAPGSWQPVLSIDPSRAQGRTTALGDGHTGVLTRRGVPPESFQDSARRLLREPYVGSPVDETENSPTPEMDVSQGLRAELDESPPPPPLGSSSHESDAFPSPDEPSSHRPSRGTGLPPHRDADTLSGDQDASSLSGEDTPSPVLTGQLDRDTCPLHDGPYTLSSSRSPTHDNRHTPDSDDQCRGIVRWYHIIVSAYSLMGVWKFVATMKGQAVISNVLDIIIGTIIPLMLLWLKLYQNSTRIAALFQNNPAEDTRRGMMWMAARVRRARHGTARSHERAIIDTELGTMTPQFTP